MAQRPIGKIYQPVGTIYKKDGNGWLWFWGIVIVIVLIVAASGK